MARILIISLVTIFSLSVSAEPGAAPPARDMVVGVSEVQVPETAKAGEEVPAVVSGVFPNGCYRWKDAQIGQLTEDQHAVQVIASVAQGMCIMVLVPFAHEISLGSFEAGLHVIYFMGGDGTYLEKTIEVIP